MTTRNFEVMLAGHRFFKGAFCAVTLTYAGLRSPHKVSAILSRLYFQSGFRGASGEYELPRLQVQILRSGTSGVEARADINSWCIDFGF
jgi:hypothetical protein